MKCFGVSQVFKIVHLFDFLDALCLTCPTRIQPLALFEHNTVFYSECLLSLVLVCPPFVSSAALCCQILGLQWIHTNVSESESWWLSWPYSALFLSHLVSRSLFGPLYCDLCFNVLSDTPQIQDCANHKPTRAHTNAHNSVCVCLHTPNLCCFHPDPTRTLIKKD